MIEIIAYPAILAGAYALWIVGMPDFLRVAKGTVHVRSRVSRHMPGPDGFVPIFAFHHDGRSCEVPGPVASATPTPAVGTGQLLSFPAGRPELARVPAPFARSLLYCLFAAWLGFFTDLAFNWW